MDGVGPGGLRRGQRGVDAQIAFRGRPAADADRVADLAHVERVNVGFGMYGDRPDAPCPRRAGDPASDLATVGDEKRLDLHYGRLTS